MLSWRRLFDSVHCLDRRCYCRRCSQHNCVFRDCHFHRGLLLLCVLPVLPPSFAGDSDCDAARVSAIRVDNPNINHTPDAALPSARELQPAPTRQCSASSAVSKLSATTGPVSSSTSTRPASYASASQCWRARQVLEWTLAAVQCFLGEQC